ncbi:hypothetical protein N9027_00600 [bacterium]|nr:hypothetical protein [bacterium]MDC1206104.1 hypothetical protein [Akkermansiaceae bacterium]
MGSRPKLSLEELIHPIKTPLIVSFSLAIIAGLIGFLTNSSGTFGLVKPLKSRIPESKHPAFLIVAWAQSASYLSVFIGGIILSVSTWRRRGKLTKAQLP